MCTGSKPIRISHIWKYAMKSEIYTANYLTISRNFRALRTFFHGLKNLYSFFLNGKDAITKRSQLKIKVTNANMKAPYSQKFSEDLSLYSHVEYAPKTTTDAQIWTQI